MLKRSLPAFAGFDSAQPDKVLFVFQYSMLSMARQAHHDSRRNACHSELVEGRWAINNEKLKMNSDQQSVERWD